MINNIKKSLNKPEVINQKRKITKELWKNPDYRNKIISKAGNFYEITFPNGDIKIIKNLSKFCNEHDLNVKTVTYHLNNQTIYKNYFIIKKDLNG
jgi:predicted 3-demethylubiquinone-9 3-methyltransferase (glyoxalase superfamily)